MSALPPKIRGKSGKDAFGRGSKASGSSSLERVSLGFYDAQVRSGFAFNDRVCLNCSSRCLSALQFNAASGGTSVFQPRLSGGPGSTTNLHMANPLAQV